MAKKKRKRLPYRAFRIYFSKRTGRQVKKTFRGRKFYKYGYVSTLTGNRIPASIISKNARVQGLREAFPDYRSTWISSRGKKTVKIVRRSDATRRKIVKTIREYKTVGFNALEDSPELGRYFDYLKKKKPRLYRAAVRAAGLDAPDLMPEDIENFKPVRRRRKRRGR